MERALRRATWGLAALAVLFVVVRIAMHPWAASDPVHSRWLTIEALLEEKTFAIGYRVEEGDAFRDVGRMKTLPTVDVMLDPETKTFYSSKPPFLQVLYAPLVRALAMVTGAEGTLALHRAALMRLLLLLVHALPFALCLAWLTRWLLGRERPAVALVIVALAGFGTFVTTFSNALSNHVPAALACFLAVLALLRVQGGETGAVWFALAGLCAGFAAALEYPAATLVVAVCWSLSRIDRARALLVALPAALAPLLLSHATDFLVFDEPWFFAFRDNDWFQYAGSYWKAPRGLDAGDPSLVVYAFHSLIGHHGVFLLMPCAAVALLAAARPPAGGTWRRGALLAASIAVLLVTTLVVSRTEGLFRESVLPLGGATLLPLLAARDATERDGDALLSRLLLACAPPTITFYLAVSDNYGGITSGPRWLLWLTPLFLLGALPIVRRLVEDLRGRVVLSLLFALSALSALWPGANPYRHPWSYVLYEQIADAAAPAEPR